jgi:hypothetical protein
MMTHNDLKTLIKESILEVLSEDYHRYHKDYRLYEGNRHIVAIFEDNTRLAFEVHFRNNHGEDKELWRERACSRWKSLANKLHSDVQLSEGGNPIEKTWKECFEEALNSPELKEFIRKSPHNAVYRDENAPVIDSVNFTKMG